MAFWNGLEVNVYVGDPAAATTDADIIADSTTPGYPTITDVYWNGSANGATASNLGDMLLNDVIRLFYLST